MPDLSNMYIILTYDGEEYWLSTPKIFDNEDEALEEADSRDARYGNTHYVFEIQLKDKS